MPGAHVRIPNRPESYLPVNRNSRCAVVLLSLAFAVTTRTADAQEATGLRVPDGFTVTLFADDDLAHDIHSLTIDSLGRVTVSGPGYVRFLPDDDGDGKADRAIEFVSGPKTGAQGMYFDGRNLLCSGDAGLQIYRDDDRDDTADGPPEVFRRAQAGGEHHVHSIQKGPDGWWYVIAGNYADITDAYITTPGSPVRYPESGVLLRISADFTNAEVVADGFRNAYDFACSREGDVFTFDSDGERDVSLPWYRPTRVFHVLPMSHAGWISRSWKRPDDFMDMPPVLGSFGRGSPTGVVAYQHSQFPQLYHDAIFVLDWTYGRVFAMPRKLSGSVWSSEPIEFMTGTGAFGFAPTDAAVGPDGSLYVSVGGRGTRGGVYRVSYTSGETTPGAYGESPGEKLGLVLNAPQPLSSWSRARWVPLARELGRAAFVDAALNESLSVDARRRAIAVLTELFEGVDSKTAGRLVQSNSPQVRAKLAWAIGRQSPATPNVESLLPLLTDASPLVRRFALEALQSASDAADWPAVMMPLAENLKSPDRFVRTTAARVVAKLSANQQGTLSGLLKNSARGLVGLGLGVGNRSYSIVKPLLETGMAVLESEGTNTHPLSLKLDAVRLVQLGLGDVGPRQNRPPAFDGYQSQADLAVERESLETIRTRLAAVFPTGDAALDREIARTIAMLQINDPALLDRVLATITDDSDPIDDLHFLLVAARIGGPRTESQSDAIAMALAALDRKIRERGYAVDTNWNPRVTEVYRTLAEHDLSLPERIAATPDFGRPPHVLFLSLLKHERLEAAIERFAEQINQNDDYPWNNQVVRLLAESSVERHQQLVRSQIDNPAVGGAVLRAVAKTPLPEDLARFVESLDTSDRQLLEACLSALAKLETSDHQAEDIALFRLARRLNASAADYQLREQVMRRLSAHNDQDLGFVFGAEGHAPQRDALRRWQEFLQERYPEAAANLTGGAAAELATMSQILEKVDWSAGDAQRGRALYVKHSCGQCHGGRAALGPDLSGVTGRFSQEDLFTAIVAPNQDVSSRYSTTQIVIEQGKVYQGLIIYRSVDGLLLRTPLNATIRIRTDEIEAERTMSTSLMPTGLLRDASAADYADLYAYLQTLQKSTGGLAEPMSEEKR